MPSIFERLKFFMIAPRFRRRGAPPTLVDRGYTVEPLSYPFRDDEIADRAELPSWTMTEALFWLGGYRSPGYESDRHMQDHFWYAYHHAVISIEEGILCKKKVRAGETIFTDSTAHWLAWADRIGPEHIKVDERVRRALSQTAAGRPTLKTEIEAAYKELRDAKEIDFDAPKNKLYEPIRKKVRAYKNDPSLEKGLQNEAIRKVIYQLFETDKSARPTSP